MTPKMTRHPFDLLPAELWLEITDKLKESPQDLNNFSQSSPHFLLLLHELRPSFLLQLCLPIVVNLQITQAIEAIASPKMSPPSLHQFLNQRINDRDLKNLRQVNHAIARALHSVAVAKCPIYQAWIRYGDIRDQASREEERRRRLIHLQAIQSQARTIRLTFQSQSQAIQPEPEATQIS